MYLLAKNNPVHPCRVDFTEKKHDLTLRYDNVLVTKVFVNRQSSCSLKSSILFISKDTLWHKLEKVSERKVIRLKKIKIAIAQKEEWELQPWIAPQLPQMPELVYFCNCILWQHNAWRQIYLIIAESRSNHQIHVGTYYLDRRWPPEMITANT